MAEGRGKTRGKTGVSIKAPALVLKKGMSVVKVAEDVMTRVEKTLTSERFDFRDIVGMACRASGINPDLEQDAAGGAIDNVKTKTASKSVASSKRRNSLMMAAPASDFALASVRPQDIVDPLGVVALVVATDIPHSIAGPDPMKLKAQQKGIEVLYELTKVGTRDLKQAITTLKYQRGDPNVPPPPGGLAAQSGGTREALVRGLEVGTDRTKIICATMLRSLCKDGGEKGSVVTALWRKDPRTKHHEAVTSLLGLLRGKALTPQEDACRLLSAMGKDADSLIQLGRKPKMQEALVRCLPAGTPKCKESAVWLVWRMSQDDSCSKTLGFVPDALPSLCSTLSPSMREANDAKKFKAASISRNPSS
eukprot:CAMPEP_0169452272 /NCGR_PEP_ID=MMETSP1042-20121227/14156_1 /TAXON_ID=464988 /ORGANISM="Hemiselmis andersenii, Strain CCMP1180" /LENGTH=363 /DNA_ID=CAMNT_0009564267 /DNA_START=189 /DNA_END=1277 /DNA_ORIENTATION=+